VLAGWVRDDSVFAITAAGFLHHGSIYDVFESRYKASRPLDLNPLDLQGTLHSACCSADGGRFAVVTVSGRVELWDAEDLMRLKSWQMTPSVAPFKQVCVALSGSGRQVAFACGQILRVVEEPLRNMDDRKWERHVLWVDDRPRNNEYERENLAKLGIRCTLALSTDAALDLLARRRFAVVISDMGREEGPSEGYVLLRKLRSRRSYTPFFIYAGSNLPEHRAQAKKEGAQGSTNNWTELLSWITAVIPKLQSSDRS
jgi:CheY-like chemotaxis protein